MKAIQPSDLISPTKRQPKAPFSHTYHTLQSTKMMTSNKAIAFLLMVVAMLATCRAYSMGKMPRQNAAESSQTVTRQNFLKHAAAGLGVMMVSQPAWAKDNSAEGTKKDPAFEACLSQCE